MGFHASVVPAPAGMRVYYVSGNHEAGLSQYDELKEGLKSAGVIVLEDEAIQLEHNGSTVT